MRIYGQGFWLGWARGWPPCQQFMTLTSQIETAKPCNDPTAAPFGCCSFCHPNRLHRLQERATITSVASGTLQALGHPPWAAASRWEPWKENEDPVFVEDMPISTVSISAQPYTDGVRKIVCCIGETKAQPCSAFQIRGDLSLHGTIGRWTLRLSRLDTTGATLPLPRPCARTGGTAQGHYGALTPYVSICESEILWAFSTRTWVKLEREGDKRAREREWDRRKERNIS